ncbi:MAG: radical SAM protein [Candidatus Heimdallarchaeaceae archaeon]
MQIEKIIAKTLIHNTAHKTQYHLNPYQGCYHDCKYCNGKAKRFYLHDEFSNKIKVKVNAPELLEQYLRGRGFYPINRQRTDTLVDFIPNISDASKLNLPNKFILFIGGGICDVYQPAEEILSITNKLLQIAYDYCFPIRTLTKNSLVLRDINLFKKIHKQSFARVSLTITLSDQEKQRVFEPRASTTEDRFSSVKKLREEGLPAGVYMTPLLPFIGDTRKNLEDLFKRSREVNAEFVVSGGLILRPGKHKVEMFSIIKEHYPELLEKYTKLYINDHSSGIPDTFYSHKLNLVDTIKIGYEMSKKYQIPFFEPRYIPENYLHFNLRVSTVLSRIAFLKSKILPNSSFEAIRIQQDSILLETLKRDLKKMSSIEVDNLPLHDESRPYVLEMLELNQCQFLIDHKEWDNLFYKGA